VISLVIVVAQLGALAVAVVLVVRRPAEPARRLRWAALILTALVAVVLTPYTVADSGAAASYLLGVPALGAALPVAADLAGRSVTAATAVGAAAIAAWSLLLALGIGLAFLPGALLLVGALAAGRASGAPRAT
jgi:hypothetical protein